MARFRSKPVTFPPRRPGRRGAGENAGTASHVENLLPRHEAGSIGNGRRPIGEQGGDESLLVDLGDPERYLESLTGCRKCPIGVGHGDHLLLDRTLH